MRRLLAFLHVALAWLAIVGLALPAQAGPAGLPPSLVTNAGGPIAQIDNNWPATQLNSGCWTVQVRRPETYAPATSPQTLRLIRQGFDGNALPTLYTEDLVLTQRVRQPSPAQAALSADRVALSDFPYATDFAPGVKNACTSISPKPVCAIVSLHRSVIGNSVTPEIVCAHRNARANRQVAAVTCRATDGTNNTPVAIANTTSAADHPRDQLKFDVYKPTVDTSGLNNNTMVTLNCSAYPWIGTGASVLNSADNTGAREFSPRYYLKNTTLLASPYYAYVCKKVAGGCTATGTSGGVFSTTASTAAGTPFDTIANLFTALNAGAAGRADGVIVRVSDDDGTPHVLGAAVTARNQDVACITITRDPLVARANARIAFPGWRARLTAGIDVPTGTGCAKFADLAITRTSGTFFGEAANPLEVQFEDVDFDNNSQAGQWLTNAHDYFDGVTFTNISASSNLGPSTYEHRLMRGCTVTLNALTFESWWTFGCKITNPGAIGVQTRPLDGGLFVGNVLTNPDPTAPTVGGSPVRGFGFLQNVVEYTTATTQSVLRIAGDNAQGDVENYILHHNTFVGAWQAGRWNVFYDEGASPRYARWNSVIGNIGVAFYTKGDIFRAQVQAGADAPSRTGNWSVLYGVGWRGNFTQYQSQTPFGGNEAQAYPGLSSMYGTSTATPQIPNASLFADFKATTCTANSCNASNYQPGAGGGDYDLLSGNALEGIVTTPVLGHDIEGVSRPSSNDTPGAYVPGMAANDNGTSLVLAA